jgi:hypothetical protein
MIVSASAEVLTLGSGSARRQVSGRFPYLDNSKLALVGGILPECSQARPFAQVR